MLAVRYRRLCVRRVSKRRFGAASALCGAMLFQVFSGVVAASNASASPKASASASSALRVRMQSANGAFTFSPSDGVTSLRVQVKSLDGEILFDSGWVESAPIVWQARDANGPLPADVYPAIIEARTADGKIARESGSIELQASIRPISTATTASAQTAPSARSATSSDSIKPYLTPTPSPPPANGRGTPDRIARWLTPNILGDSIMRQSSGQIIVEGGLQATSTANNGVGVYGIATGGTGVVGTSERQAGVYGFTSATTNTAGVYGAAAANGTGVFGTVSGTGAGVSGQNTTGAGVRGQSNSGFGVQGTSAQSDGVRGTASVLGSSGVRGENTAGIGVLGQSQTFEGVRGISSGATAPGVSGFNINGNVGVVGVSQGAPQPPSNGVQGAGPIGVLGRSDNGNGVQGVSNAGNAAGVFGLNNVAGGVGVSGDGRQGDGVLGVTQSAASAGVRGANFVSAGVGVFGETRTGVGVFGTSQGGDAISGRVLSGTGTGAGVVGQNNNTNGVGVRGIANASGGVAVLGASTGGGLAGRFDGNVRINGTLVVSGTVSKGGGTFEIDSPRDPANKILTHSFVESPDMMNIYNGVAITDKRGRAVVTLPPYFNALNRDFRYQLTCVGGFAPVYVEREILNNRFSIAGGKPGLKVSWQVTGVRRDAWANANRVVPERDKGADRGTYLHPALFGPNAKPLRSRSVPVSAPVNVGGTKRIANAK